MTQKMTFKQKCLSVVCAAAITASGFVFGIRSTDNLKEVDPRLTQLSQCAIKATPTDFVVVDGMRSQKEHEINLKNGVSWIKRSRHQDGCAIDIAAYKNGKITYDPNLYFGIIGAYYQCSEKLKIPIISGGEWKAQDLMHIELPKGTC